MSGGLAQLLASMERGSSGQSDKPLPLPEAQIASLREAFALYRQCPFKAGDIITLRTNSPNKHIGIPHIVIEVRPDAEICWKGEAGTNFHGQRLDIRVACLVPGGQIAPHWDESWCYVPYAEPQP
jgi:hypothetical protein